MSFPQGIFNVRKCVEYLRAVGVEVSDEQATEWDGCERVSRFIASTRRTARSCERRHCRKGHEWVAIFQRRKRKEQPGRKCPECGGAAWLIETIWLEGRDGSITFDRRDPAERWKPLEDTA